jgi:hypothetical protein
VLRIQQAENERAGGTGASAGLVNMPKKLDPVGLMTAEQAAKLQKLAFDAYEPEAFNSNLTQAEAEQRIAVLRAKLKLMDGPPHTL